MSDINRIANLLLEQIRSRQTLAIGTAQSAAIQGARALYQTPSGIISAIATNFCYGDCLLAKVEGTWYAINPSDNRAVVRGSVDRLIQKRPKVQDRNKKAFLCSYLDASVLLALNSNNTTGNYSADDLQDRANLLVPYVVYGSPQDIDNAFANCLPTVLLRDSYSKITIKYLFSEAYLPLDTSFVEGQPNAVGFQGTGIFALSDFVPYSDSSVAESYSSDQVTITYKASQYSSYIFNSPTNDYEIANTVTGFQRYYDYTGEAHYYNQPYYFRIPNAVPSGTRFTLQLLEILDQDGRSVEIGTDTMTIYT